jgi:putative membrane protein
MREVFKRIGQSKGIWSLWIPIELVLALSCIYELMEWGVAVIFGGDLGVAYLGSQGDIWDAQKDMLNAGIGALAAMITTSFFIIYYNSKGFWSEIRDSLSIKDKEPLGEVALAKLAGK